jgi:DNA-binding NarL/FixJ family response regulator
MQTLIPGMADDSVEFFKINNQLKFMSSGQIKNFSEAPASIVELLQNYIDNKPKLQAGLQIMHPDNSVKQLEQFVSCRLGGLDYNPDVKNNKIQNGEYQECANRGKCAQEGIVCKLPKINNHRLTIQEVKVLQLTSSPMLNEVIGEVLNLPMGTLHKIKKNIYAALGICTKQEGASFSHKYNLI